MCARVVDREDSCGNIMDMHNPPHSGGVVNELDTELFGVSVTGVAEALGSVAKRSRELSPA